MEDQVASEADYGAVTGEEVGTDGSGIEPVRQVQHSVRTDLAAHQILHHQLFGDTAEAAVAEGGQQPRWKSAQP